MCGIVGFASQQWNEEFVSDLEQASAALSHRGPDDSGIFFDPASGIGMAHRRLSIIDLSSGGRQPMASEDGQVVIVYNGEVYNFKEVREELQTRGHGFRTATDTEVILNAYLEWGEACLEKFVGMFALAIWDGRYKKFVLARDRIGIKPLFYYHCRGMLFFASELKAIMAFRRFPKEIDEDAIPLFLHYQYVPAPRTVFRNTYKLEPGHVLICSQQGIHTKAYWQLPEMGPEGACPAMTEHDALDALDQLLTQAVSDRLVSDVPLGALLSGGIDSSIVTAMMQKVNPAPVKTFSIGFNEKGYNEAPWAAKVAEHLGTDHTELYVTPGQALEVIPRLCDIYDEPFADSSAIPTFLVSRLTRTRVTVALSGDGGDEQFCGYVRYWTTRAMLQGFSRMPEPFKRVAANILKTVPPGPVEAIYNPLRALLPQRFRVANFPDKWQKLISLMDHTRLRDLYRMTICLWSEAEIRQLTGRQMVSSTFEKEFDQSKSWSPISRMMRTDQQTYLPDAMLTKVDRASMAVALEVRVPLLDHRVVNFTARLPDDLKFRNGEGKYLLKRLLARYVPPRLFERPKMGFGIPLDHWFRTDLKPLMMDYLSPDRLKREGLFDHRIVSQKVDEHLRGKANHQYRLWTLLIWQMWRQRWLENIPWL